MTKTILIAAIGVALGMALGALSGCVTSTKLHMTDGNATINLERTMDTRNESD